MPIAVDIDVMLAKRKMPVRELAERVGITPANLAVLKNGRAKGRCCVAEGRAGSTPRRPGSDCECEFGEDRLEPAAGLGVESEFVVAARPPCSAPTGRSPGSPSSSGCPSPPGNCYSASG